ncbi:hemolysin [Stenotrophomonas sp. S41]|uniref:lipase family protein n=1 Tax=Stenotrophomonas sp. S41 TaxID=2767464 RepID=UPI001909705B|nr:hemolysin [Stenotrophomonas sp. S41]MBK0011059.1 hemolysin [Stenotrophomonas sp. S41]
MSKSTNADLSDATYSPPQFEANGDAKEIDAGGGKFVAVKHMDLPSGYQGTIYKNVETGDYVVAHRGTEFDREPLKDGAIDLGMVTTRFNGQLKDALELTREAKEMADRDGTKVSVTGHSLGGALAQVTAHHYNLPGEAFNPYGANSLGYRIPAGQPTNAAPFTNHVMAGDFVSAGGRHYGSVEMYALPSELRTLRHADFASRVLGGVASEAIKPLAAGALGDSHRMKHFVDHVENGVQVKSVLENPSARITDPDDQRRVDAYRTSIHQVRSTATVIARGAPGLAMDAVDAIRGPDESGAYAQRQAAAKHATPAFNPAEHRNAPGSDGGPRRENPSFHSESPLGNRLNDLLNADPDRFKVLNQQASTLNAGQALDTQVRNQANAEDRAREHAQSSAQQPQQQAAQQTSQQEHAASAVGR